MKVCPLGWGEWVWKGLQGRLSAWRRQQQIHHVQLGPSWIVSPIFSRVSAFSREGRDPDFLGEMAKVLNVDSVFFYSVTCFIILHTIYDHLKIISFAVNPPSPG